MNKYVIIRIENIYTNLLYSGNNLELVKEKLQFYKSFEYYHLASFMFYYDNEFYLLHVSNINNSLNILNLETKEYISNEKFIQMSQLREGDVKWVK